MSARATSTATNEAALIPNTTAGFTTDISTPATAGPTTLAKLNWAEFRAMALTRPSGGTRDGTKASQVGPLKAKARPCPNVSRFTRSRVACPVHARMVSAVASSIITVCVNMRILRRSSRSVYTPPTGETTMGKKLAKVINDTQNAEWVSRRTYQASAMDCIHVPMFERNAPVHIKRKFR